MSSDLINSDIVKGCGWVDTFIYLRCLTGKVRFITDSGTHCPDKTAFRLSSFTYWIFSRVQRSRPAQYGHSGQDFPSG